MNANIYDQASWRKGVVPIRVTQALQAMTGLTITSRRAIVSANGKVLKMLINDTLTIPPGAYQSVVVDPLLETYVYGGLTGLPTASFRRFHLSRDGQPIRTFSIRQIEAGASSPVEWIRLNSLAIDAGTLAGATSYNPVSNSEDPMGVVADGIDVSLEYFKASRWYPAAGFFQTPPVPYFLIFVLTASFMREDLMSRYFFEWGLGTESAPVPIGQMACWLGKGGGCGTDEVSQLIFGVEVTTGLTVIRHGFYYPPYTGATNMPNGAFQVYALDMSRLSLTDASGDEDKGLTRAVPAGAGS